MNNKYTKYTNRKKMKITSSSGIYKTIYHNIVVYCCLEKENDKVLKFHVNNSSYLEISPSLF